jgi:hypothetical protein
MLSNFENKKKNRFSLFTPFASSKLPNSCHPAAAALAQHTSQITLSPVTLPDRVIASDIQDCCHNIDKQGCQIFLVTIYQNEGKYTKLSQHYQMAKKYNKWS